MKKLLLLLFSMLSIAQLAKAEEVTLTTSSFSEFTSANNSYVVAEKEIKDGITLALRANKASGTSFGMNKDKGCYFAITGNENGYTINSISITFSTIGNKGAISLYTSDNNFTKSTAASGIANVGQTGLTPVAEYSSAQSTQAGAPITQSINAKSFALVYSTKTEGKQFVITSIKINYSKEENTGADAGLSFVGTGLDGGTYSVVYNDGGSYEFPVLKQGENDVPEELSVTYSVENTYPTMAVASIDGTTGAITLTGKVGFAKVKASWGKSANYKAGSAEYTLKVSNPGLRGYTLTKGVADLEGAKALIYCTSKGVAMGAQDPSKDQRKDAVAVLFEGALYPSAEATVFTIEKPITGSGYVIKTPDGKYLATDAPSGTLKTQDTPFIWSIKFNGDNVAITGYDASNNGYTICHSNSGAFFNAYTNSQTVVQLYIIPDEREELTFSFDQAEYQVDLNQTKTIKPTATFNGETVTLTAGSVVYASDDPETASVVASTGLVTGVSAGKTKITAKFKGNETYKSATAQYQIEVVSHLVSADLHFDVDEYTREFKADLAGENTFPPLLTNTPDHGLTITYSSSIPEVATIDPTTGAITLHRKGSTMITASWAENDTYTKGSTTYTLTVINSAEKPYVKVTDAKQLYDGAKVIVVYETGKKVMGLPSTTDYLSPVDVANLDGSLLPDDTQMSIIQLNKVDGGYTLKLLNGSDTYKGKYFYHPKQSGDNSSNKLKTQADPQTATITVDASYNAKITFVDGTSYTYSIGYNETSPRFTCYKEGQKAVQLYMEPDSRPIVELSFEQETYNVNKGETLTVTPTATVNGTTVTLPADKLTYSSSNTARATVDNAGVVSGVEHGQATITVKYAGGEYQPAEASYIIKVVSDKPESGLKFNLEGERFEASMALDNEFPQLTCEDPEHGLEITYSSSVPGVATIDATTGVITLVDKGETTITASWPENDKYAAGEVSYILSVSKTVATVPAGGYKIVFKQGAIGADGSEMSTSTSIADMITTGAYLVKEVKSATATRYNSQGGVRLSTNNAPGSFELILNNKVKIDKIYVKAKQFSTQRVGLLKVNDSDEYPVNLQSIDDEGYYLFRYNPQEVAPDPTTLKFEGAKNSQVYISEVIIFGDMEHTKCEKPEIEGGKKTYFPGETITFSCSTPGSILIGKIGDRQFGTAPNYPFSYTFTEEDANKALAIDVYADNEREVIDESEHLLTTVWVRPTCEHAVVFKSTGTTGTGANFSATTTVSDIVESGGSHLSGIEVFENVGYNTKGGIRLSGDQAALNGKLKLGLKHYLNVSKVIVHVTPYNTTNGGYLQITGLGSNQYIDKEGDYVFETSNPSMLSSIEFCGIGAKRVYISDMLVYSEYAEDPSICLRPTLAVGEQTEFVVDETIEVYPGDTFTVTSPTEGSKLKGTLAESASNTIAINEVETFSYTFKNSDVSKEYVLSVNSYGTGLKESPVLSAKFKVKPVSEPLTDENVVADIVFTTSASNANGSAITTSTTPDQFVLTGAENLKNVESANFAYHTSTNGLKLGSSSEGGNLTLKLAYNYAVEKIVVNARQYNGLGTTQRDPGYLSVNGSETYKITDLGYYVYEFTPDEENPVSELTFTVPGADKMVYVKGVTIYGTLVSQNKCAKPKLTDAPISLPYVYPEDRFTVVAEGGASLEGTWTLTAVNGETEGFEPEEETVPAQASYSRFFYETQAGKTYTVRVRSVAGGALPSDWVEFSFTCKGKPANIVSKGKWKLVDNINQLEPGERYIIAAGTDKNAQDCSTKAISNAYSSPSVSRKAVDLRVFGYNSYRYVDEVPDNVLTFKLETADDGSLLWKAENYKNEDGTVATQAYLYNTSKSTILSCGKPQNLDHRKTSVTIDEGTQHSRITFENGNGRMMRYDRKDNDFVADATAQASYTLTEIFRYIDEPKDYIFPSDGQTLEMLVGDKTSLMPEGLTPKFSFVSSDVSAVEVDENNGNISTPQKGSSTIQVNWPEDLFYTAGSATVYVNVSKRDFNPEVPAEVVSLVNEYYTFPLGDYGAYPEWVTGEVIEGDPSTVEFSNGISYWGKKAGTVTLKFSWGDYKFNPGSVTLRATIQRSAGLSFRHETVRGKLGVGVAWMKAYNSSPAAITYSSSNPEVVTINAETGQILPEDVHAVGESVITAEIPAYGDYPAATARYKVIIEAPAKKENTSGAATFDFRNPDDAYGLYHFTSENINVAGEERYERNRKDYNEYDYENPGTLPINKIVSPDGVSLYLNGDYRLFESSNFTSLCMYYSNAYYDEDKTYLTVKAPIGADIKSITLLGEGSANQADKLLSTDESFEWGEYDSESGKTVMSLTEPVNQITFNIYQNSKVQIPCLTVEYEADFSNLVEPNLTFTEKVYNVIAGYPVEIPAATSEWFKATEKPTITYSIDNLQGYEDKYEFLTDYPGYSIEDYDENIIVNINVPGVYTLRAVSDKTSDLAPGMAIARINVYPWVVMRTPSTSNQYIDYLENWVEDADFATYGFNYSVTHANGGHVDFTVKDLLMLSDPDTPFYEQARAVDVHYVYDEDENPGDLDNSAIVHNGSKLFINKDTTLRYRLDYGGVYQSPEITHRVYLAPQNVTLTKGNYNSTYKQYEYTLKAPEGCDLYYNFTGSYTDKTFEEPSEENEETGDGSENSGNQVIRRMYSYEISPDYVKASEDETEEDPDPSRYNPYILSHKTGEVTFVPKYQLDDNDYPINVHEVQAFATRQPESLVDLYEEPGVIKGMNLHAEIYPDGTVTGIDVVYDDTITQVDGGADRRMADGIYDMMGRRISKPTSGFYIEVKNGNARKVMVK